MRFDFFFNKFWLLAVDVGDILLAATLILPGEGFGYYRSGGSLRLSWRTVVSFGSMSHIDRSFVLTFEGDLNSCSFTCVSFFAFSSF